MLFRGVAGGYRVPLLVPGRDFAVGARQSPIHTAYRDTLGTSDSSINVTGALVATEVTFANVPASVPEWTVGQYVSAISRSNVLVTIGGTIVSHIGTNLVVLCAAVGSGTGTKADWDIVNLPIGMFYDSGAIKSLRMGIAQTVSRWDFTGIDAGYYGQHSTGDILFQDCAFSLENFTPDNISFIRQGANNGTVSASYCTIDGANSRRSVTSCFGARLLLAEYCDVTGWPNDWVSAGNAAPGGATVILRKNRVRISCSVGHASGLHPDGVQITNWDGGDYEIDGNLIDISQTTAGYPYGGSSMTAPITFGVNSGFEHDVHIHDNLLIGGSYCTYWSGDATDTGTFRYLGNYVGVTPRWNDPGSGYGSIAQGGVIYPSNNAPGNLEVDAILSAFDGSTLPFIYNYDGSHPANSVTSV